MNNPDNIKFQVVLRVTKVATRGSYGIDKKFIEKIEEGDFVMIQTTWGDCIRRYGSTGKSHEVIITNKGISKKVTSDSLMCKIFNRILEYEQLSLL